MIFFIIIVNLEFTEILIGTKGRELKVTFNSFPFIAISTIHLTLWNEWD